MAIAAIGSVSLVAVTWMALSPHLFHRAQGQEELSQPDTHSPADALSGAPASYGAVPKLGPPLPGDPRRPLLDHHTAVDTGLHPPAPHAPPHAPAPPQRPR